MSSQIVSYVDRAVQLLNKIGIMVNSQADASIFKVIG